MKAIEFLKIKYRLFMLGASDYCMPIDIFSLSNKLKELYPDSRVQGILEQYVDDESAFVRRAILTTIRFIGGDFAKNNIEVLRTHLQDKDEWVSYDAIWALSETEFFSEGDAKVISDYAQMYSAYSADELENIKPESAGEHRCKKAAEILLSRSST